MTDAEEFSKLLAVASKETRRKLIFKVYSGVKQMITEEEGSCDEEVLINVLVKAYRITDTDVLILKSYSSLN
jgi:hypothetical protein